MKLLTSSAKTVKGEKLGYFTMVQYFMAADKSGYNVCPKATEACRDLCLGHNSGRMGMTTVQKAQYNRTINFMENREAHMDQLVDEIGRGIRYAHNKDLTPVIRLNGTSDIRWENMSVQGYPNLMEMFADYQFYDYTKLENRRNIPVNYDLTFSRSENNGAACEQMLADGVRIAVCGTGDPFSGTPLSWGYPIMDGDEHDLTFLQPAPSILWLQAKGKKAKEDISGFTVHLEEVRNGQHLSKLILQ